MNTTIASRQFRPGRFFAGRIPQGAELFDALGEFCGREGIACALFRIAGNFQSVSWGCLDQRQQVYVTRHRDAWLETGGCTAFASTAGGKAELLVHATLSGTDGQVSAGRLFAPTVVHAAEFVARELGGEPPARVYDPDTGLMLWDL